MKTISFIACSLFCIAVYSQDVKKWTLEECIQYAIDHNIDIKQKTLQKENASIDLNTAKMSRLPDLNASVGQTWNAGVNQTLSGIYENQTNSNASLSISSSIPLFTGFKIPNQIEQNKLQLEAAVQSLEKAKDDLSLNIASSFLNVLFNQELLKVSEDQLALSQSQIERTQLLVDVGKVPQSQLFDIKAQVAKDELSVVQSKNNLQLSLLDLAQSLELERTSDFDVAIPVLGDIVEDNIKSILPPEQIYNNAVNFKPQIKEQELLVKSAQKSLGIARSGYYPSLNLNLGYGNAYLYDYTNEGKPYTAPDGTIRPWHNDSFRNQFKSNGGEYIGLSLNIPIFNRFAVRNQVKSARLNIDNQQLTLDNTKKTLFKEIQTAYLNATAAQAKYTSSVNAVIASQEAFKYAQEKYEVGKSSVFEFNDARTKLIQSLSEQIQAKYDFIFRSKILDFYNGLPIKL
ncbi:MAG: TolC family protein [Candidatus Azobacteroides sp.]|nr:TolC family protein [Candidatus Azobacteroides sp.]